MSNNLAPYDLKKALKNGLIYLLIAFPVILIVCTVMTILKAPFWLSLLMGVVLGGVAVFVCYVVHTKIVENKKKKKEQKNEYDPFKD